MYDAIADDNVLRPNFRPFLTAQLGEQTRPDRAVVNLALSRCCTLCRPTARTILARLMIPTNLPLRITGTRLIRFASINGNFASELPRIGGHLC